MLFCCTLKEVCCVQLPSYSCLFEVIVLDVISHLRNCMLLARILECSTVIWMCSDVVIVD